MIDKADKDSVREVLRSQGWAIIMQEVITPYYESLSKELDALTSSNAANGPVLAGQKRAITKVLDMMNDYMND